MGPGIFTGGGHFIVFTGYSNGMFSVNDPFSKALSNRKYSYNEIKNQIKALWAIGR